MGRGPVANLLRLQSPAVADRRYIPKKKPATLAGWRALEKQAEPLLLRLFALLGGLDDLVGDVLRTGGVVAELHGELATAGGHGAEVTDVAEHRRKRGLDLDADATGK